jgi:hypothetical protein
MSRRDSFATLIRYAKPIASGDQTWVTVFAAALRSQAVVPNSHSDLAPPTSSGVLVWS